MNNLLFYNAHLTQEINYSLKIIYAILFLNYAINDYEYLKKSLDKIIFYNFVIVSTVLLSSYFFGVGLSTYTLGGQDYGLKGFFDGGNSLSAMLLVFFIYFFYYNKKYYTILSLLLMVLLKTKAIFLSIIPLGIRYYNIVFNKKSKLAIVLSLVFFALFLLFRGQIENLILSYLYSSDYSVILERQKFSIGQGSSFFDVLYYSRRVSDSLAQFLYQFQSDFFKILFGFGRGGQIEYWNSVSNQSTQFGGMDQFDILFRYGIIGLLLFLKYYIFPLIKYYKYHKLNITLAVLFVIFGYSFFGGYVIISTSLMTFVALFLNEVYVNNQMKKLSQTVKNSKTLFYRINEI